MIKAAAALAAIAALTACATVAANSIESDLKKLGLSDRRADCLAEQLRDRLDSGQIVTLADYIARLERADSSRQAFDALTAIEDPGIAAGVFQSGLACSLTR
jgi:hypothetical protein